MKVKNVFLRRLSIWIFFSIIVLWGVAGLMFFFGFHTLDAVLNPLNSTESIAMESTVKGQATATQLLSDFRSTMMFAMPAIGVGILVLGILIRWILGRSFKKYIGLLNGKKGEKKDATASQVKEKIVYKKDKNKEKLLYTHLLAAFQREGQWVDFLNENLDIYEDAQIGAAVRNIQEKCKKVLSSHFNLKPILAQDQGDDITLEEGFSPDTIKLVGNVHGAPPFKGVIRHKGWKIQKVDIPDFSGEQNLEVLAPAEVEIL